MIAYAETTPQVIIRYHSVPDGHVDEPALVVLGQILSGRTEPALQIPGGSAAGCQHGFCQPGRI